MYVDESGTHGMTNIDLAFPVLTICGAIFNADGHAAVALALQRFKHDVLKRPSACIHSADIRRWKKDYTQFRDPSIREAALAEISRIIDLCSVTVISVTIRKDRLSEGYLYPTPPYDLAVSYLLERFYHFLVNQKVFESSENGSRVCSAKGSIVFESRGRREDREISNVCKVKLETGFAFATSEQMCKIMTQAPRFTSKNPPSAGLEIADLIAYPIARHVIDPDRPNPAFEVVRPKLYAPNGPSSIAQYSLKIFPIK